METASYGANAEDDAPPPNPIPPIRLNAYIQRGNPIPGDSETKRYPNKSLCLAGSNQSILDKPLPIDPNQLERFLYVASKFPNLTTVAFRHIIPKNEQLEELLRSLSHSTLKTVILDNVILDPKQMKDLCTWAQNKPISSLTLQGRFPHENDAFGTFLELLPSMTHLTDLSLSGADFNIPPEHGLPSHIPFDYLGPVFKMLCGLKGLNSLRLDNNRINSDALHCLFGFKPLQPLDHLSLKYNPLLQGKFAVLGHKGWADESGIWSLARYIIRTDAVTYLAVPRDVGYMILEILTKLKFSREDKKPLCLDITAGYDPDTLSADFRQNIQKRNIIIIEREDHPNYQP